MSFETFQRQNICGTQYLAMDDTELFDGDRRKIFSNYVALPALLLYMLVLPILTMVYLWKQHGVMWSNRKMVFRFGLLYSGYAKNRWYWEIFVVVRKILLIFIVTFGRSNESQLHYAMGVLICILYLQERGRPFEDHNQQSTSTNKETTTKQKKQQHMLHLSEVGSLVVLLITVWVAVFFNVSPCSTEDWDCIALSCLVFLSNLLFVATCSYVGCRAFAERNNLNVKLSNMSNLFRKKSAGKNHNTAIRIPPSNTTTFHSVTEMFPTENVTDQVLGAVTLEQNPLANGRNRLEFARQRAAAAAAASETKKEEVQIELTMMERSVEEEEEEENDIEVDDDELLLPLNWKKVNGENGKEEDSYYWNTETNETQYEHPKK